MKIAVTAMGPELDSQASTRFGRAPYFQVVNTDDLTLIEAIENPNVAAGGGAGVQSAQLMADREVEALVTGDCGPKAFQVFSAAKIKVFTGAAGTVREAVEKFKAGELSEAADANVSSHAGITT